MWEGAMGHVTVTVNGRKYRMSCRDGAEQRVTELAALIESLVEEVKGGYRHVQEDRLFLMAALMLADQLTEAREELHQTLTQICALRSFQTADSNVSYIPSRDVARIVDASSKRLQALESKFAAAS
jgi:cell division protein ZapA